MKISALEVVEKFMSVKFPWMIVMKTGGRGSWCRGKRGLLEHMAP